MCVGKHAVSFMEHRLICVLMNGLISNLDINGKVKCQETSTKLVNAIWGQSQIDFILLYGFECNPSVLVLCLFSAQQFSLCSQSNKIHLADTVRSHYSRF